MEAGDSRDEGHRAVAVGRDERSIDTQGVDTKRVHDTKAEFTRKG